MTSSSELTKLLQDLSINMAMMEVTLHRCMDQLREVILLSGQAELAPEQDGSSDSLQIGHIFVNQSKFTVSDGQRNCALGNTICYKFFECLASEPQRFFTTKQLEELVWDGQIRDASAIRSVVHRLRTQLRRAGMFELAAALRSNRKAYGLIMSAPGIHLQQKND